MIRCILLAGLACATLGTSSGCDRTAEVDRPAIVIEPAPPPEMASPGAVDRPLVVATWNIEWLTDDPPAGVRRRTAADYERLAGYADRLDADLIFLQEVEGPAVAARVFDPEVYDFVFTRRSTSSQKVGLAHRKEIAVERLPDVEALGLGRSRLRWGLDVRVRVGARDVRFLALHLKSGCFSDPPDSPDPACAQLFAQLPVLEGWIDARSAEGVAAIAVGDFNRRLGGRDDFWRAIDDGQPAGSNLLLAAGTRSPRCWGGRFSRYIDHFVLNEPARPAFDPESFREWVYDADDAAFEDVLSDHCPLGITLTP